MKQRRMCQEEPDNNAQNKSLQEHVQLPAAITKAVWQFGNGFLMILSPLLSSLITRGFLQKKNWMRASIAGRSNTELFSCWRENSHKMCVLFECNWKQVHTQSNLFIKSQKWACAAVAESKRTAGSSYMLWIEILINVFLKAVSHTETHSRTREKRYSQQEVEHCQCLCATETSLKSSTNLPRAFPLLPHPWMALCNRPRCLYLGQNNCKYRSQ